jgi:hypothetical protein
MYRQLGDMRGLLDEVAGFGSWPTWVRKLPGRAWETRWSNYAGVTAM